MIAPQAYFAAEPAFTVLNSYPEAFVYVELQVRCMLR